MEPKMRFWQMADLEDLLKYANNPKIAANLSDGFPHPFTEQDGVNFIESSNTGVPYRLCIEMDKHAVGAVGIHKKDDIFQMNAELGYWLAESYWGRGIMTHAIRFAVEYGFNNFDINRIYARTFGENVASQRVLVKAGLVLEARFEKTLIKQGELRDELIWGVRK